MEPSRRDLFALGALGAAGCISPEARRAQLARLAVPSAVFRAPAAALSSPSNALLRAARAPAGRDASFPLGVLAGDATDDAAVVWTCYRGAGRLALAVREAGGPVVFADEVPRDADGFAHVDVRGLRAGREHRYVFLAVRGDGRVDRGPAGRVRTAPPPDAAPVLTFGGTSCTCQDLGGVATMARAAERRDLEFFLHAGDHVYVDWISRGRATTLAQIRECYARGWTAYGMSALHASVGLYATWDDHEVANNWDPETLDPLVIAAARRAWFEHHPLRRDGADPWRIWKSFRWGRTLELFVLDCRGERRPSTRRTPRAEYLSRGQMDWLKRGLAASPCVFKLVLNSVPITNFPGIFDIELLGNGRPDRWEGYPAQRDEILRHVRDAGITGVWWLAGDYHFGSVGRVEPEGAYAAAREVLMGPGLNIGNPFADGLRGAQWDFISTACSYCVFRADPGARTLFVQFVDGAGRTLFQRTYPA